MKKQPVTKKSEIDPLLQRISYAYDELVCTLDLGFVCGELIKARVWRGWGLPNRSELEDAIAPIQAKGIPVEQVEMLIVICECLFRPLRSVELELEKILPDWLGNRGGLGAPKSPAWEFLKRDFQFLWAEKEKVQASGWILAAGAVPLPVRHRPIQFAPWVVGVTLKRWLRLKGHVEDEAEKLACRATKVLLMKQIRVEELRHWESLIDTVQVPIDEGKTMLLPAYMIEPAKRLKADDERGWGATIGSAWNPWTYVKNFQFPLGAARQVAKIIQKGWRPIPTRRSRKQRISNESSELESPHKDINPSNIGSPLIKSFVRCMKCHSQVPLGEALHHLVAEHGIPEKDIERFPGRRELRSLGTGELLIRLDTEEH